jgi:hypothetical protein
LSSGKGGVMAEKELETITCCMCAVVFGVTPAMEALRRKDFANFYCPNGHCQAYTRPVIDPKDAELSELREKVATLTKSAERLTVENTALATELEIWKPRVASDGAATPKTLGNEPDGVVG